MKSVEIIFLLILETIPYWLPSSLLSFLFLRSVGLFGRIVYPCLFISYFFLVFTGNLIEGIDQSVQILMAIMGLLFGFCMGFAFRSKIESRAV